VRQDGVVATASQKRRRPESAIRALTAGRAPTVMAALRLSMLCAAAVIALRLWLEYVGPMPGDEWAVRHRNSVWLQPTPILDLGTFFSVIGTPVVATGTVLVGTLYAARAEQWRGVAFVALAAGAVAVNAVLKVCSGVTPLMHTMHGIANLNFPSGHTVYAAAVFGAFAILARRAGRADVAWPLIGLIVLMGPFRVAVTAHFVSDVIAGYLVGIAWLAISAALVLGRSASR
jgi:membrane-associated phospholipid phosphatase